MSKRHGPGSDNTRRIIITEALPTDDCIDDFVKAVELSIRAGKDIMVTTQTGAFLLRPRKIEVT